MVIASGLVDFNQHAVAAFRVDKNDLATVRAGRGCIRQKLVTLGLQSGNIFQDVVGTETDMMNATLAIFFQVFGNRAFAIERMHQLDLRAFNREKSRSGLGGYYVLSTIKC